MEEFLEEIINANKEGKNRLEADFIALKSKAIEAFDAQTIETDKEKFVKEYLIRKGESSLSKDKSHLLDSFKDDPLILAEIQEFVEPRSKAIEAFNAQTIETDQEKFVNEYLARKGESSLSKDKSHLLDSFKDNPSILAEIQAFLAKSEESS